MSSLTDSAVIFRYHRDMIALHGNGGNHALGWRDLHSQLVRFEVLVKIADLSGCSILDAGCGHADLRGYIHKLYAGTTYIGVEQIPELLDIAMARYSQYPDTSFISANFITGELPVADYVFASGSLNYRSTDEDFIYKAIAKLYQSCRLGLGFNLLNDMPGYGLLMAYDVQDIEAYCKTLCGNVNVIRGYTENDFTVFMYR